MASSFEQKQHLNFGFSSAFAADAVAWLSRAAVCTPCASRRCALSHSQTRTSRRSADTRTDHHPVRYYRHCHHKPWRGKQRALISA